MCFSAQASFTGGAVITAIGAAALARVNKPKQIPFAAIPLIFGIQQCAEGILWITLKSGGHENLQTAATYVFLSAALAVWPTMVPLSILLLEKDKTRRKILTGLLAAGGIVSLFFIYCLINYSVTPQIQFLHIQYADRFPGTPLKFILVLYFAATLLPLFASSIRRMWLFGILMTVSCLISAIFFTEYLTSVWCFFAACISIVIWWVMGDVRRQSAA